MDSLTQALLGAATFAAVKDRYIGKKSLFLGAVVGTIPDLDVFLSPFFDEVAFLSVHRSISHSLLFSFLGALTFGLLAHQISKQKYKYKNWTLAFFLALFTHSLLDWCTTYGTKILSPFNGYLFSLNNIHVFEPIYTIILIIGVMILLFRNISVISRTKVLLWTLTLSTSYLVWSGVSKSIAYRHFMTEIENQHIKYDKIMISPTPLNTLLWNCIIKTQYGYYFGSFSLLDKREHIELQYVESRNDMISEIEKFKKVQQYLYYTNDFPLVKVEDDIVKVYAIKFGPINYFGEPEFVYPLCIKLKDTKESFYIEYNEKQRGPVKNYRNLFRRIKGI